MQMKSYFTIFVVLISNQLATVQADDNYQPLFITANEATAFTTAFVTGMVTPFVQQPMLQAEQIATTYRQATDTGIKLNVQNYRGRYLDLIRQSDIRGKALLVEQIGDQGARHYAQAMRYEPIYQGRVGQGRGFDQVYQNGKQIIVIEAKGGGSPTKFYHGYMQGTPAYTLRVAETTLHSPTASSAAKRAAQSVIKAYQEGNLVIEVVRTTHTLGEPNTTTVQSVYHRANIPSPLAVAHQASMNVGFLGATLGAAFEIIGQLDSKQAFDWQRVAGMTALSGVSGYAGTFFGTLIEHGLVSNQVALASNLLISNGIASFAGGLSGGAITSAVLAYGLYFLGYTDLEMANRTVVAGLAGSAAGALASAGVLAAAAAFGTASTGTAIASLSGAAATSATMAWIGGGAVSAGGLGVAAGSVILTGGVALIAIGVGAGVMYLFGRSDDEVEQQRLAYLIQQVRNSKL
jgi:hypothetical protein